MTNDVTKIARIIKDSLRKLNLSSNTSRVTLTNPKGVMWDLFSVLYEKQKMIYILNLNNLDLYPKNELNKLKLVNPGFIQQAVYATANDYFKIQEQIQKCYEILDPLSYLPSTESYTGNNITGFSSHTTRKIGVVRFELTSSMSLYGANAAQIYVFPAAPSIQEFANKWNTIKVPYDKELKLNTEPLYPIKLQNGYYYFRKVEFKKD